MRATPEERAALEKRWEELYTGDWQSKVKLVLTLMRMDEKYQIEILEGHEPKSMAELHALFRVFWRRNAYHPPWFDEDLCFFPDSDHLEYTIVHNFNLDEMFDIDNEDGEVTYPQKYDVSVIPGKQYLNDYFYPIAKRWRQENYRVLPEDF